MLRHSLLLPILITQFVFKPRVLVLQAVYGTRRTRSITWALATQVGATAGDLRGGAWCLASLLAVAWTARCRRGGHRDLARRGAGRRAPYGADHLDASVGPAWRASS